jgi:hypothetical protein
MTTFNRPLNVDTVVLRDGVRCVESWWAEPLSYGQFTARAREEFRRMQNGRGAQWTNGDNIVGQITDRRVKR